MPPCPVAPAPTCDPPKADAALLGAQIIGSNSVTIESVRLTVDSAEVLWGRRVRQPGIRIHAQAHVRAATVHSGTEDTIVLRMPALSQLGKAVDFEARMQDVGDPSPGDTLVVQHFTHYASIEALEQARRPYLLHTLLLVALDAGILLLFLRIRKRAQAEYVTTRSATLQAPVMRGKVGMPRGRIRRATISMVFVCGLLIATSLSAITFDTYRTFAQNALVSGDARIIEKDVSAVLWRNSYPPNSRLFDRAYADSALLGAQITGSENVSIEDVQFRAAPAVVVWLDGVGPLARAQGLAVHIHARARGVNVRPGTRDTLMLRLPALGTLAKRLQHTPSIRFSETKPVAGDTAIIRIFNHYATAEALQAARRPLLPFASFILLVDGGLLYAFLRFRIRARVRVAMSMFATIRVRRAATTLATAFFVIGLTIASVGCALSTYEYLSIPARSLLPGKSLLMDHTLWAILRGNSDPPRFLKFDRANVDSVLADAVLIGSRNLQIDAVQVRAETTEVSWSLSFGDQYKVDGIKIHTRARVSAVHGRPGTEDTLVLRLPGLGALGARLRMDPRISLNGQEPVPGDTVVMQYYTHYASTDEMQRARRPYLVTAVLLALTVIGFIVRALMRRIAHRSTVPS